MDERLYRQMVAVIRRFSFQIIVADADGYHEFTNMNGDAGDTVLVRCLTLQACYAYGNYPRGHKFMWRARRCDLTRYDVEKVVSDATHGIIHLRMY